MNTPIDILTKKVYEEGIESAQEESEKIISDAKKEASKILEKAKKNAQNIVKKAEGEAETTRKQLSSEINRSTEQAIETIKQNISNLISQEIAQNLTSTSLSDSEFSQKLLTELISSWSWDVASLEITIPEKDHKIYERALSEKVQKKLSEGVTFIPSKDIQEGFIVAPQGEGYTVKFTEEVFHSFFKKFAQPLTYKALYKNDN